MSFSWHDIGCTEDNGNFWGQIWKKEEVWTQLILQSCCFEVTPEREKERERERERERELKFNCQSTSPRTILRSENARFVRKWRRRVKLASRRGHQVFPSSSQSSHFSCETLTISMARMAAEAAAQADRAHVNHACGWLREKPLGWLKASNLSLSKGFEPIIGHNVNSKSHSILYPLELWRDWIA